MSRKLKDIIAHIRAVAANPAISTTLIQTEDLEALCDAAEVETLHEKLARWHDKHAAAFPEGSEWRKFHEETAAELRAQHHSDR